MNKNELDIIELKKKLYIKKKLELLKSKEGLLKTGAIISKTSAITYSIANIINSNNTKENLLTVGFLLLLGRYLEKSNQNEYIQLKSEKDTEIYEKIMTQLKSSGTYQQNKELYNKYLNELHDFLKSRGVTDTIEVASFYKNMLNDGYATGKTVCRHTASFLTDLEKKFDNRCFNLPVTLYTKKELISDIDLINYCYPNHLITGIIDDNKYYAYDSTPSSTLDTIVTFEQSNPTIKNLISYQPKYIYGNTSLVNNIHIINNQTKSTSSFKESKDILSDKNIKPRHLSNELFDKMETTTNLYFDTIQKSRDLDDFYRETQPTLQKIKTLNETLIPLSKKNKKHWIINK